MSWKRIYVIFKKDVRDAWQEKGVMATIIIYTAIIGILFPLGLVIMAIYLPHSGRASLSGAMNLISMRHHDLPYMVLYELSTYYLTILTLLPLGTIVPTFATSSFIEERLGQTAEGLLYTPVTKNELIVGKMAASVIPNCVMVWIIMILDAVIIDIYSGIALHAAIFPNFVSWMVGALLTPLAAILLTEVLMIVSQHVKKEKSGRAVSILIVVPVLFLVDGRQSALILQHKLWVGIIIIICAVLCAIMFIIVAKTFNKTNFLFKH